MIPKLPRPEQEPVDLNKTRGDSAIPVSANSHPWSGTVTRIAIAAILTGGLVYIFHDWNKSGGLSGGVSNVVTNTVDSISRALSSVASSFVQGTFSTTFRTYSTEINPTLSLQVATLKANEEFTYVSEKSIAGISLPNVKVTVKAPVEYIYYLDLSTNANWHFELKDKTITATAPPLQFNLPAFHVSSMQWEVNGSIIRPDEEEVKQQLNSLLMGLAIKNAKKHIPLVHDKAQRQAEKFVNEWLASGFKDGKAYRTEVVFREQ